MLFYTHDAVGLGHLRRTLTLAEEFAQRYPGGSYLLASGSEAALSFRLPPGLEVVKLPSVGKGDSGEYNSRRLNSSLHGVVRIRRALLLELVESFRPHVLVVDNKVLGVARELEPALARMRELGGKTVLGLRDILDSPARVAEEWGRPEIRKALVESYDSVCVYGAPELFDMRTEYPVPPELSQRVNYVGYVVRPRTGLSFLPIPRLRPQLLVTTGGGEDGAERVERCLDALELAPTPWDTTVVLGPLLDAARRRKIKRRARAMEHVTVHGFYEDMPRLFEASTAVVSMAGYNTVTELLRGRLPAVLLPRTKPREEQLLRARRVEARGCAQVLEDPTPRALRAAMEDALSRGKVRVALPSLDGARGFSDHLAELLELPIPHSSREPQCASRIS